MKRRVTVCQIVYYLLVPAVFFGMVALTVRLFRTMSDEIRPVASAAFLIATPVAAAVLMRFSLLRRYLDPPAALEIPLTLYAAMIANQLKETGELLSALRLVNRKLADDGGMGFRLLGALFVLALACSFSIRRKRGESLAYRILGRSETGPDHT